MSKEPVDFYETFKDFLFAADLETDVREKSKAIRDKKEPFKNVSASLESAEDWIRFGAVQKALMAETIDCPVPFFPFATSREACRRLEMEHDNITRQYAELNIERAENLLKSSRRRQTNYLDRHRHAENAIRMVYELLDDDDQWRHEGVKWPGREKDPPDRAAYRFIAECYLHRSRLALPKGESIPEKKLEALGNAWSWAEKASDKMDELKAEIVLEQLRWNSNYGDHKARERLLSFVRYIEQNGRALDEKRPLHQTVNDALHSLNEKLGLLETRDSFRIFDEKLLQLKKVKRPHYRLALFQARAAVRLDATDLPKWLDRAVNSLDRGKTALSLANPLWNDTVKTIGRVAKCPEYKGQWEAAALKAWEGCRKAEKALRLSVQVRWYWARQKNLYDLAFKAALEKDPAKAAEIADGQKSRPTMKILDMERSLKGEDLTALKRRLEIDAMDFMDTFIVDMDERKRTAQPDEEALPLEKKPRPINEIPKGWASVHFYIIDQENAWAIVVKKDVCDGVCRDVCKQVEVKIEPLHRAYLHWEAERRVTDIDEAIDPRLETLLEEIGLMLKPVLDAVGEDNIVFVPHGFLHLTPLHAAILPGEGKVATEEKTREIETGADGKAESGCTHLFERKHCLFLPSWSLAPTALPKPADKGPNILKSKWKPREVKDLDMAGWDDADCMDNTPDNVINALTNAPPPGLFALYCHGQGDMTNPYNARFLLQDGSLTHARLRSKLQDLQGARVALTACETDLVSGNEGLTDEHLSLAAAFFEKGASEVAGTLFKCKAAVARDFLLEARDNPGKPLHDILGKVQTKYKGRAHEFTPFRVMGYPSEKETAND